MCSHFRSMLYVTIFIIGHAGAMPWWPRKAFIADNLFKSRRQQFLQIDNKLDYATKETLDFYCSNLIEYNVINSK